MIADVGRALVTLSRVMFDMKNAVNHQYGWIEQHMEQYYDNLAALGLDDGALALYGMILVFSHITW